MKILFAAPENAWGGFLNMIRSEMPGYQFDATGDFNLKSIKGYDVLIPTMCRVTSSMITDSDRLRLIQQCGAGLEAVDIEAAKGRDIWVANVPTGISGNADSVAELGIYIMIGLLRNPCKMTESLSSRKMGEPIGGTLKGRTVGLIGLGGIGRALVKRLHPFDVRLIGIKQFDLDKTREELGLHWIGGPADLKTLLEQSDFVVLCLPLTKESKGLLNRKTFSYMKKEAYLINLSRGGLVDRQSLEDVLSSGKIAGAGLDVFWGEPPDPADPIFSYNVIATPHIGGVTDTSMNGIVRCVAENIRRIAGKKDPLNHFNF